MKETTVLVVIVLENIMSQETETKSNNDSNNCSVKTRITATKPTALSIFILSNSNSAEQSRVITIPGIAAKQRKKNRMVGMMI